MSKSIDNLKTAFAGESQANRRYLAFAKKADQAGFPQIARLFRAAAAAETIHAHNHLRAMDGVKDTAENLQAAIAGENYEVVTMYPTMLAEAQTEGDAQASISFRSLSVAAFSRALQGARHHRQFARERFQDAQRRLMGERHFHLFQLVSGRAQLVRERPLSRVILLAPRLQSGKLLLDAAVLLDPRRQAAGDGLGLVQVPLFYQGGDRFGGLAHLVLRRP